MTARQKQVPADEDLVVIETTYEDKTKLDHDLAEEETAILNEFGASDDDVRWLVKVYRAAEGSKNMTWLFDCAPSDLPVSQRLCDQYGSGIYRVRVLKNGKMHRVLTYAVEAPLVVAAPAHTEMTAVTQALTQQGDLLKELVNRTSNPVPQQPTDMVAMMTGIAGVMSQFQQMIPQQQSNQVGAKEMFEIFSRGADMARDLSNGAGETNVIDLVREFIRNPEWIDKMTNVPQVAAPAGPAPQLRAPQPSIQSPSETPAPAATNPSQEDQEMHFITGYLNQFLVQARSGKDAALYADLIVDNIPLDLIDKVLQRDDLKALLVSHNAEIGEYWDWFEGLISYLKEALTDAGYETHSRENVHDVSEPAERVNGHTDGQGGDQGNTPANVDGSQTRQENPGDTPNGS